MTTSSARDRARRNGPQRRNTHREKSLAYGSVTEATTVIEYLVDGEGRRVGKKVDGVLERGWLWSGKLRPVAELDAGGAVVKRFVYADGVNVPELMVTGSTTYRLVKDHLGSVRRVVDVSSGVVLQAIEYDAWGRVLSDTNPGAQPFGLAGGLYDADTGLVRFGARDYDADTGRWTSNDASRFDGGDTNLYAYVGTKAVDRIDPTGRSALCYACASPYVTCLGACGAEFMKCRKQEHYFRAYKEEWVEFDCSAKRNQCEADCETNECWRPCEDPAPPPQEPEPQTIYIPPVLWSEEPNICPL